MKLKRILLVEDNENDAELTMEALSEHNLANEVDRASDGAEALDYLYQRGAYAGRDDGNLAVILLDLKLPKVDGLEVLRTIKSDEKLKFIPVVVLTFSQAETDILQTYDLHAHSYLTKPLLLDQVMKTIQSIEQFGLVIIKQPAT